MLFRHAFFRTDSNHPMSRAVKPRVAVGGLTRKVAEVAKSPSCQKNATSVEITPRFQLPILSQLRASPILIIGIGASKLPYFHCRRHHFKTNFHG